MRSLYPTLFVALAVTGLLAAPAGASQMIARGAQAPRLAVDSTGQALVSYESGGRTWNVLAWGAVNALSPTVGRPQRAFRLDYSGGGGRYGHTVWRSFRNACRPYDGPPIAYLVRGSACKALDGSYWALQSWQVRLPNLGFAPWLRQQRAPDLHLAHWTGEPAKLEAWTDWVYDGRYHSVFGRLTYAGRPVYGFGSTRLGATTDRYGRLVYLDTFNSPYGPGWRRENAFLVHRKTGGFCYGFFPLAAGVNGYPSPRGWLRGRTRGPGAGARYRASAWGPGVTPDVKVVLTGLHDFDPTNPVDVAYENTQNGLVQSIFAGSRLCHH